MAADMVVVVVVREEEKVRGGETMSFGRKLRLEML